MFFANSATASGALVTVLELIFQFLIRRPLLSAQWTAEAVVAQFQIPLINFCFMLIQVTATYGYPSAIVQDK